jgi:hypothetical protein
MPTILSENEMQKAWSNYHEVTFSRANKRASTGDLKTAATPAAQPQVTYKNRTTKVIAKKTLPNPKEKLPAPINLADGEVLATIAKDVKAMAPMQYLNPITNQEKQSKLKRWNFMSLWWSRSFLNLWSHLQFT